MGITRVDMNISLDGYATTVDQTPDDPFGLHAHPGDPDWRGWWGENPPFGCPVFVLTHETRPSLEMEGGTTFHFVQGDPAAVLAQAQEAAGGRDVRIGGGVTVVRDFLRAGLVDRLHVGIAPILLGRGERIWEGLRGLERRTR